MIRASLTSYVLVIGVLSLGVYTAEVMYFPGPFRTEIVLCIQTNDLIDLADPYHNYPMIGSIFNPPFPT